MPSKLKDYTVTIKEPDAEPGKEGQIGRTWRRGVKAYSVKGAWKAGVKYGNVVNVATV